MGDYACYRGNYDMTREKEIVFLYFVNSLNQKNNSNKNQNNKLWPSVENMNVPHIKFGYPSHTFEEYLPS